MQLQPVGFLGYKQILLALNVALKVPQHGAMPKGNVRLAEFRLQQPPPHRPAPSCPFCQHCPLHDDRVSRFRDCHLFQLRPSLRPSKTWSSNVDKEDGSGTCSWGHRHGWEHQILDSECLNPPQNHPWACRNRIAWILKPLHLPESAISLYTADLPVHNLSRNIKNDITDTPITWSATGSYCLRKARHDERKKACSYHTQQIQPPNHSRGLSHGQILVRTREMASQNPHSNFMVATWF